MAPTSRAAARLAETAGIRNPITVHRFLLQPTVPGQDKRLLLVDEASLASTRMVSELWKRLGPEDRVILVGDPRQHQSVEAGRFFEAALEQGMKSVRLDTIMRQQDEKLRRAVELLAQGRFYEGVKSLREQGRFPHGCRGCLLTRLPHSKGGTEMNECDIKSNPAHYLQWPSLPREKKRSGV
jgi:ATP-dependent exoDNAse (exonuclease V) alpha subunit